MSGKRRGLSSHATQGGHRRVERIANALRIVPGRVPHAPAGQVLQRAPRRTSDSFSDPGIKWRTVIVSSPLMSDQLTRAGHHHRANSTRAGTSPRSRREGDAKMTARAVAKTAADPPAHQGRGTSHPRVPRPRRKSGPAARSSLVAALLCAGCLATPRPPAATPEPARVRTIAYRCPDHTGFRVSIAAAGTSVQTGRARRGARHPAHRAVGLRPEVLRREDDLLVQGNRGHPRSRGRELPRVRGHRRSRNPSEKPLATRSDPVDGRHRGGSRRWVKVHPRVRGRRHARGSHGLQSDPRPVDSLGRVHLRSGRSR